MEYVPEFRSGPYAIIIALCRAQQVCPIAVCVCFISLTLSLSLSLQKPCWIGYLTKSQLMTQAQPHCDKSFTIVSPLCVCARARVRVYLSVLCVCERETVIHMLHHSQMMASTTLPGVQWQPSSERVWSTRGAAPPSQSLHSRHHYDIIAITSL